MELHIGYVYGATKPPPHASRYSPKFVPGARLPHCWISFPGHLSPEAQVAKSSLLPQEPVDVSYVKELGADQVRACQWCTLDLCGPDSWSLIPGKEYQNPSIALLQKQLNVIGLSLNTWRLGVDFEIVRQSWFADELVNGGGILIRPDQHILARVSTETNVEDVVEEVRKHLGEVLEIQ